MQVEPLKGTTTIKITDIKVSEERKAATDLGDIKGLVDSIELNGLITPIVVDTEKKLIDGYRRVKALIHLKVKEVDARFYEDLSDFARMRIRVESELQKKQLSWQEETALKAKLHELYAAEFGTKVQTNAPNTSKEKEEREERARGGKRRKGKKKKWEQKQTAQILGIAKSTMSEDLKLAAALQHFPQLKKITSKRDAIRKMYRLREFELLQERAQRDRAQGKTQIKNIDFIQGDCLDLIKEIDTESVDLVVTDPPWGIDLKKKRGPRSKEYSTFEDKTEKVDLYKAIGTELWRVMKPGAHLYIFFGIQFYKEIYHTLSMIGFDVREVPCIWVKEGGTFTNWEYKPMPQYENIFFAAKVVEGHARQLKEPTTDVFTYTRPRTDRIHPTEKPVELMKRLISLSSAKNEIVLDPFAGSATTLIAAAILERRAIGYELNQELYDAAFKRLSSYVVGLELEAEETEEEAEEE